MKQIIIGTIILSCCVVAFAASSENTFNVKKLDNSVMQNSCDMTLQLSNYGVIGPKLLIPSGGSTDYLYTGGLWIGGRQIRRNAAGQKLYWVAQHPSADSSDVIAEDDQGWNSSMIPVVDTLTTEAFDGDLDLYELLPAYNPLISSNPEVADLYAEYNSWDNVMKSIFSGPSPRPFAFPDPENNYCFTYPNVNVVAQPAPETCIAYYYDKCPFGTAGERDWGTGRNSSNHVPLRVAVEQHSYAWPLENLGKMIVFQYKIYNMCWLDTLYDVALSYYMDNDIGPVSGGSAVATDDQSGYVMGDGYEFAYSKDADGDNGQSPYLVGCKFYLPQLSPNRCCYYWRVGDGPNDFTPLSFSFLPRHTANEKYWLMTGRNPKPEFPIRYQNLRGGPSGTETEYLQTSANDTRYLYSYYGNQPTAANPHPAGRINIPPSQSVTAYMVIFASTTLDSLKLKSQQIDAFIASGLDIGNTAAQVSYPFITDLHQTAQGTVHLAWFNYNEPATYRLYYKTTSATQWQMQQLQGTDTNSNISGLTDQATYQFRLVSTINPGPNEQYLESQTESFTINNTANPDPEPTPSVLLTAYPNPMRGSGGTVFAFKAWLNSRAKLSIYNAKGQKLRVLANPEITNSRGIIHWDGTDHYGKPVPIGVYFCRLQDGAKTSCCKVLVLK